MNGWKDLDLEGKAGVVWALCGIAVCVLLGYSTVKSIGIHNKMAKRLHLDGDDDV